MNAIAIDGPAGAGKSTLAKALAKRLSYIYVDTGALYRAIGLLCLEHGVDGSDTAKVGELLTKAQVELGYQEGAQRVFLGGVDVTQRLRTPEVSRITSTVSALSVVRDFLFDLQQEMARRHNVVMDGRDIGTVVLPQAQVKIFLTASPEERARRRVLELQAQGVATDFDTVLADMMERDKQDTTRAVAPLRKADDAIEVDTGGEEMEESLRRLESLVKERLSSVAL